MIAAIQFGSLTFYLLIINFNFMLTQPLQSKFTIRDGHEVIIESGRLARQADGSVTVRQGNCIILATVVANKEAREGQSFFPWSYPGIFLQKRSKTERL